MTGSTPCVVWKLSDVCFYNNVQLDNIYTEVRYERCWMHLYDARRSIGTTRQSVSSSTSIEHWDSPAGGPGPGPHFELSFAKHVDLIITVMVECYTSFEDTIHEVPQLVQSCVASCGTVKPLRLSCKSAANLAIQHVKSYRLQLSESPSRTEPLADVATLLKNTRLQRLHVELHVNKHHTPGVSSHYNDIWMMLIHCSWS